MISLQNLKSRLPPSLLYFGIPVLVLLATHAVYFVDTEPYYNNDETRHVMTGVFFHDFFLDLPRSASRQYVIDYYIQYPALGLLVWPPLFYVIEGLVMIPFGISYTVSRILMLCFLLLSCYYLFLLVRKTHSSLTAAFTILLYGLTPLVFIHSSKVMLEIPTLAFALGAIYHFDAYLQTASRRQLYFAAFATAFALLTRFDALFLLPLFLILVFVRRKLPLVLTRHFALAAALTCFLIAPAYSLTAYHFGWAHFKGATDGTNATSTSFLAPQNFLYYPSVLPQQLGWPVLAPALLGFVIALRPRTLTGQTLPYAALVAATYASFTPLAELEPRHAIYWVPAFTLLAASGLSALTSWLREPRLRPLLPLCSLAGTLSVTAHHPPGYVRGYAAAAQYVLDNTKSGNRCLFDNFLNGNFIFQLRRGDPNRHLWILRADKLFYTALSDPHLAYDVFVKTDQDIIQILHDYDPEFVIVEFPQIYFDFKPARLLRNVLQDTPSRFQLEATIPLLTNEPVFQGASLRIYRSLLRNPCPRTTIDIEMIGLRTHITTHPGGW